MKLTITLVQRGVLWAIMLFTAAPALATPPEPVNVGVPLVVTPSPS